jgi:hypothetical protein
MADVLEQEPRHVANALDATSDELPVECARNNKDSCRCCTSDQATLPVGEPRLGVQAEGRARVSHGRRPEPARDASGDAQHRQQGGPSSPHIANGLRVCFCGSPAEGTQRERRILGGRVMSRLCSPVPTIVRTGRPRFTAVATPPREESLAHPSVKLCLLRRAHRGRQLSAKGGQHGGRGAGVPFHESDGGESHARERMPSLR